MTKFILKTVEIVFIGLLAVILLAMGVSLAETVFNGAIAFFIGVAIVAFVIGGIIILKDKIYTIFRYVQGKLSKLTFAQMAIILFVFSTATKVFFVFLFDNNADLHSDTAKYRSFASQIANQGFIVENADYALKYKYTMIFGLFLSPFAKIFGDNTKVFTTVLSVLHSVSLVLIFDMMKKYINVKSAFGILIAYCCLPFGLLQTQILIHENALFFFHILAFWLFFKAIEKETPAWLQAICMIGAFFSISIGKSINALGRVVMVSFFIIIVAKLFENKFDKKKLLCSIIAVACLFGSYVGASSLTNIIVENIVLGEAEKPREQWVLPYAWPIYLGGNYERSGVWHSEDRDIFEKLYEFETIEEAHEYQRKIISERYSEYTPLKMINHLFNKFKKLYGWQEFPFRYEQGNKISIFIGGSIIYKALKVFNSFSFLFLYSIIFLSKIKSLKHNNYKTVKIQHHCQMVIIGVTLALLLFEVMPKYTSPLHILFFIILATSLKSFFAQKTTFQKKSRPNNEK